MARRNWKQVAPVVIGGLLAALVLPDFWAMVVVPLGLIAFFLMPTRQERDRHQA